MDTTSGRQLPSFFRASWPHFPPTALLAAAALAAAQLWSAGNRCLRHTLRPHPLHCIVLQKEQMLNSAINGTLNVLRSCKKNLLLKRVILTSSSSTVRIKDEADLPPNVLLDETSWSSIEYCESLQILAEKAAWEFAKEHKIDLVTVLPTFVIGPSLSPELGPTSSDVLGLFQGETGKFTVYGRMDYVHIDDVASCHILAYEAAGAQGRYICNAAVLDCGDLAALLMRRFPSYPIPKSLPTGSRRVEEMFDDTVESLVGHRHLPTENASTSSLSFEFWRGRPALLHSRIYL
uniref:NAD-dependent epimerase/dehydratase domain-containing protein n=1 Tax=Setaria viridis TaxID=4556 RepID=A0A4U6UVK7_SETVI|nr:hypothetical protein SEVIR_5G419300v2 [Setaria viridis]